MEVIFLLTFGHATYLGVMTFLFGVAACYAAYLGLMGLYRGVVIALEKHRKDPVQRRREPGIYWLSIILLLSGAMASAYVAIVGLQLLLAS